MGRCKIIADLNMIYRTKSKQEAASTLKPRLYLLLINSFSSQKSQLNLICLDNE